MSRSKNRGNRSRRRKKTSTGERPVARPRRPRPSQPRPAPVRGRSRLQDLVHSPENPFWRWFFIALVLIATWLVYMNGLAGGWLLDDYGNIVNNTGLVMHGFSWAQLWHAMWSFNAGPLGRPLSLMTFALERYFGGLHPGTFKTVNLAMHLAAVVLLYGFTRALLYAWRHRLSPDTATIRIEWVALAIAAAWALHPINLEPVLYAVQRETIFAAIFTLAGLWLYVYLRERFSVTTWPVLLLLAVELIVFTLIGAFAKETGVLLPLFTLVIEAIVFRFRDPGEEDAHVSPWLYVVPFLFPLGKVLYGALAGYDSRGVTVGLIVATLAIGIAAFYVLEHGKANTRHKLLLFYGLLLFVQAVIGLYHTMPSVISGSGFVTREFNLPERVLTEGRIVLSYIGMTLVPWLPAMALHHDYYTLSTSIISPPMTLVAFIILGALLVLAWWLRRRNPLVALGIFWFFASQVLESTVFPLELAYEHRVYLGDWGIILAVAAFTVLFVKPNRIIAHLHARRGSAGEAARRPVTASGVVAVLALATVILLGSLTAVRAWHWRSNLALAKTESRHHPNSPRGTYLLARIETNKALSGERQFARPAFEAAQKAAKVKNAGLDPWVAMVLLAAQTGRPVQDAWFDGMVKAVGERPFTVSDVNALEALVSCYTKKQCRIKRSQIERLFRAIDKSPRITKLGMNYANVLVTEANFIGYKTAAQRARSAPKLKKAADVERGVAQFQINVFNVALQDHNIALAQEMLARVEKLNKLGALDIRVESMRRSLSRAKAAQSR